jgi:hypothetical protein
METATMSSTRRSTLGPRLRQALACVILPGLALGAALGCGPGTSTTAPTITTIYPTYGNAALGTTVVVTGSGFSSGLTNVLVGGVAALPTANAPFSDTTLTLTVPAAAVTGSIAVVATGGTAYSPNEFVVIPTLTAPTVPVTGSASGQTPVTITGEGLMGISQITINATGGGLTTITPVTQTANEITLTLPTNADVIPNNQITLLNNYQNATIAPPLYIAFNVGS